MDFQIFPESWAQPGPGHNQVQGAGPQVHPKPGTRARATDTPEFRVYLDAGRKDKYPKRWAGKCDAPLPQVHVQVTAEG